VLDNYARLWCYDRMGVYNRLMIGYEKFMWENMSWNLDSMGYKYKLWKTK
jgi:hypothetical protein